MGKPQEERILQKYSRKEIGNFVSQYSSLPFDFSSRQYARNCNLGIDAFKAMIAISIIHCIVDDKTVDILEQKAVLAAYQHHDIQDLSVKSVKRQYDNLRAHRKNFNFSDEETTALIMKYALSPLPKKDFCKDEGITIALFDRTFVRGISICLVTDDIVSSLQTKSALHSSDPSSVERLYQKLFQARSSYKEAHEIT